MDNLYQVKFRSKGYLIPGTLSIENDKIFIGFKYNKSIIEEIKSLDGARYHGFDETNPRKIWSIKNNEHNLFQLEYLTGGDPYNRYDQELISWTPNEIQANRNPYPYQIEGTRFLLTRKQCILAMEPGCGKTLVGIMALEEWIKNDDLLVENKSTNSLQMNLGNNSIPIWVGPRSALASVQYEFIKWKVDFRVHFHTYESLKKLVDLYKITKKPPKCVIFDESSKLKTPTAQRSQAARIISEIIREKYKDDGIIILMTGTPAPKSPIDWYNQAEIARPGFLKEGNIRKFEQRLGLVIREENSTTGGMYPKLVTWFDNSDKCQECGKIKDDPCHQEITNKEYNINSFVQGNNSIPFHQFKFSVNEVTHLSKRLKGLVLIKLKNECLQYLPEKIFRIINLEPTSEMLNAARLIIKTSKNALITLSRLRELSDGFQYEEIIDEKNLVNCPLCKGRKVISKGIDPIQEEYNILTNTINDIDNTIVDDTVECIYCKGVGKVPSRKRIGHQFKTPKEDAVKDLLDEYEDVGRIVIGAGFTASIDRCCQIVKQVGWEWIRVDGRGWLSSIEDNSINKDNRRSGKIKDSDYIQMFQEYQDIYPKIAFIMQPKSGGYGLTLTASPVIIRYSNDFDGDAYMQFMERIHRPGMDLNKGATIIDLICLPSDMKVLKNLQEKKKLQSLSMGEIAESVL